MANLLKAKRFVWGLIFLLVTVVAGLVYVSGSRYLAAVRAIEQTLALQSAIEGTLSLLKDAETGGRGFMLTGDEGFLEPYQAAHREIPGHIRELERAIGADPAQLSRLRRLEALTTDKIKHIESTTVLRRAGDTEGAQRIVRAGGGKRLMDAIRQLGRQMREHETLKLHLRHEEAREAQTTAVWGIGVGSFLTIALAGLSFLTVNRDVTLLRRTAEELAESEEHFRLLSESTSDLVRLLDPRGKVTYVSPSVERLLGYTPEEFLAQPARALLHPDEDATALAILSDIASGRSTNGVSTYRLRNKAGEYRYFEVRWSVLRDESGAVTAIHTSGRDVTERRLAEELLTVQAETLRVMSLRDELTGLFNRRGFLEVAGHALAQAVSDGRSTALLFVDLNGMKRINDELGHDVGDTALGDAGYVLSAALGPSDVVARLGGDEFVAFARDFVEADLGGLRLRIRQLCDERAAVLDRPYRLSMSVGGAFTTPGDDSTIDQLLERADAEMYAQKRARKAAGGVSLLPTSANK
jgi:diguanylate cyclase (GGDEF)-like protein/PAS domain S-box-containing protein